MRHPTRPFPLLLFAAMGAAGLIVTVALAVERTRAQAPDIPLKEAKLNIEHNATDKDTGFQGAIDSEGWQRLDVTGPNGQVLTFEGRGSLGQLGLTELFFETVEPANADVPIEEMLAKLPEGNYTISGPAQENGVSMGQTSGTALLTHDIPEGPKLVKPAEDATVPDHRSGREVEAGEQDDHRRAGENHRLPADHREGRRSAQAHDREVRPEHVPIAAGDGDQDPGRVPRAPHQYAWEVLAIERSGNQTLSSGAFQTR